MFVAFLSVITTVAFAVLCGIPWRAIIPVGFLGLVAWLLMLGANAYGVNLVGASFIASLTVSLLSEGFARAIKMPVSVFSVPGIVVLVPGISAYTAMKGFVERQYLTGIAMGIQTLLVAGALASGLVIGGILARSVWRTRGYADQ